MGRTTGDTRRMSLLEHFPVLLVVVPLITAPVCASLPYPRAAWALTLAASASALLMAIWLLGQTLQGQVISYAVGGWVAPWGIEYRIDVLNALVAVLVAGVGTVVTPFARLSVASELDAGRIPLFYSLYLLCLSGLLGMTVTGDAFNVFVFLEISSLSSYTLIALGRDRRALTSAFQYLVMGTIGATFILIGIGLLYVMTGTLNMADLASRLQDLGATRTVQVAFAFLTVGICLKLALFPLHLWLPNAYTYAPSAVTALLASTATKVAVYLLLRFFFTVFGPVFSMGVLELDRVLLALALVAMLSMSLVAMFQDNVKRMLAYSSVAQIGYIILGISMASLIGVTAGILHLVNHALIKGALFLALGCVVYRLGSAQLDNMQGLGRTMPWTMAAFVAAGLSLIGIPGTTGFVSKWYLILGALERGWWPVAALVLITSLMAVVYIWRVVEVAYFMPPSEDTADVAEAPWSLLGPTWVLVAANFYFGIDASRITDVARVAAGQLLGAGP